jgi:hypothetical protein
MRSLTADAAIIAIPGLAASAGAIWAAHALFAMAAERGADLPAGMLLPTIAAFAFLLTWSVYYLVVGLLAYRALSTSNALHLLLVLVALATALLLLNRPDLVIPVLTSTPARRRRFAWSGLGRGPPFVPIRNAKRARRLVYHDNQPVSLTQAGPKNSHEVYSRRNGQMALFDLGRFLKRRSASGAPAAANMPREVLFIPSKYGDVEAVNRWGDQWLISYPWETQNSTAAETR